MYYAFTLIQLPRLTSIHKLLLLTSERTTFLKLHLDIPQQYTTVVKTSTKNIQGIFRTTYTSNKPIPN